MTGTHAQDFSNQRYLGQREREHASDQTIGTTGKITFGYITK